MRKSGWYKRRLPPLAKLPPEAKRARKMEQDLLQKMTPEERLHRVTKQITDLESQIKENAAKFETVRNEMLTGIVTHESVSAKEVTDELMAKLDKLQKEHKEAAAVVDREAVDRMIHRGPPVATVQGGCPGGCKQEDLMDDPAMCISVCTKCHATYDRRLDNRPGNVSYADYHPGEAVRIGGYRPPNHLAEIVAQFQGKRRSTAPQEIVDKIREMCQSYKLEKHKITPDVCRMFLKQMQQAQANIAKFNKGKEGAKKQKKFTDYYKHCTEIAYRLSGIPPPYMTPMQENRVFALFPMVVAAYKTSPRYIARKKDVRNRKTRIDKPNNMNYHYVFYKECEMLGYTEFLPYIPLPKSLANLDDNDQNGWRHCCETYGWAYTPTR